MTGELIPLAVLVGMQLVLGIVATANVAKVVGNDYLLGSRGRAVDLGDTLGGRMHRARANGFEAITYFAPLALMLVVSGASTSSSVAAAWIFVAARAIYWVCYAADLVPWRSIVWFVGWFALMWMLIVAISAI